MWLKHNEVYFLLIQQFEVTLLVRETINPLWGESITQTDRGSTIFHAQLPTAVAVSAPGGQRRGMSSVVLKSRVVHVGDLLGQAMRGWAFHLGAQSLGSTELLPG